jgi:hypothetical protein
LIVAAFGTSGKFASVASENAGKNRPSSEIFRPNRASLWRSADLRSALEISIQGEHLLRTLAVEGPANPAAALVDNVRLLEHFRRDALLELHEAEPFALLAFRITFASITGPNLEKYSRNVCPVVEGLSPPTKILRSVFAGSEIADLVVSLVLSETVSATFSDIFSGIRTNLNPGGTGTDCDPRFCMVYDGILTGIDGIWTGIGTGTIICPCAFTDGAAICCIPGIIVCGIACIIVGCIACGGCHGAIAIGCTACAIGCITGAPPSDEFIWFRHGASSAGPA